MTKGFGIGDLASMGFGQVGQLFEGMDQMRKTWSAMSLPASMTPTLSLEELDKRIGDLRAVEQWLALNQNMLRGTIQALEVQRGTIATIRSFGQAAGMQGGDIGSIDPRQLAAIIASMQQPGPAANNRPAPEPARAEPTMATSTSATDRPPDPAPTGEDATASDPTRLAQVWWNALQQQFQQIADAALGGIGSGLDAGKPAQGKGETKSARPGVERPTDKPPGAARPAPKARKTAPSARKRSPGKAR